MINSKSQGNIIQFTAISDVKSGEYVINGRVNGVSISDVRANEVGNIYTIGVFSLDKTEADTFSLGQSIYYDVSTKKVTSHSTPIFVGHSWGNYGVGDSVADIRLSYAGNPELENSELQNLVYVESLLQFPEPDTNGIITLKSGKTYIITTNVDLQGARLETDGVVGIQGLNAENCSLTSSGLGASFPLIRSNYSLPMKNISISSEWAIDIDGSGNNANIDWLSVNFISCPKVGRIKDVSNFIYRVSAVFNSSMLEIDGTIGTVGIETCLLQGNGQANDILKINSTCVIQRRIRCLFCSFIAFGSQTSAINLDIGAAIPSDSYILFKCNFSGGISNYLLGVQPLDNKSSFEGNKGIGNSGNTFSYYMQDNTTTTIISTQGQYVKILGATTPGEIVQRFDVTDNRATNLGDLTAIYKVSGTLAASSANNRVIGVRIAKNGVTIPSTQIKSTTNGNGRSESISFFGNVPIDGGQNDFIEIFIACINNTNNITVTDLNVIGERIS